ncbi:hypothetical protein Kpol_312p11, partial [Vanderwaltozyma polyspora DSM 70294]
MRVRKRTSRRTSTRMREGIKKKAAAQNRKEKKLAKKDPTWKSRAKKDPGIPASFPYKAKILEEIEAKKLKDLEEKELAKQQRMEAKRRAQELGELDMDADLEEEEDAGNGLTALMESAQQAAMAYEGDNGQAFGTEGDLDIVDHDIDFFAGSEEGDTELEQS